MFGIDISNHQKGINLSTVPFDFAFVKATEGVNYTDPSFLDHVAQLTKLGKRIGCYHFARPDNHGTVAEAKKEADWFLSVLNRAGISDKVIMVLDWEHTPTDRIDLAKAWLERVKTVTGRKPFIYANSSVMAKSGFNSLYNDYGVWLAQWPANYNLIFPIDMEWIRRYRPTLPHDIWQYTSSGMFSGWNGRIDCDYTEMGPSEWDTHLGIKTAYQSQTPTEWATSTGLFKGDENGEMRWKDPITREEVAIVLRRFYGMI